MEYQRVDTQQAYKQIRQRIIRLELAPGAPIDDQQLAEELAMGLVPVREALKLLAHDDLVLITPRHGLYVAEVSLPDLEQFSEMRLSLESLAARLAAQRAKADDLAVMEALARELPTIAVDDSQRLFDLDHRFHQATAQAAYNKYLARTLEFYLGLSQRLWTLALPHLGFLPAAVEEHLALVAAIEDGDPDRAEAIMRAHVQDFYGKVRRVLSEEAQ